MAVCACALLAGCGAKTPTDVVKAWAEAYEDGDEGDVMYYSLQDQRRPRFGKEQKSRIEEFRKECGEESTRNRWKAVRKGTPVREYVRGDRAWVIVDCSEADVEGYELVKYDGRWKVCDPDYGSWAVSQ